MIGTPAAYLLWAILSCFFLVFLLAHLWLYDRFKCVRWNSGRQPGAFKRVMTYSYLASVPLLVVFSVATTAIKFREGFIIMPTGDIISRPISLWQPIHRRWVLPLNFVFCTAWALEMVTHLEELAFWLYLINQGPAKREWFHCWEYRTWYIGSIISIIGMLLTAFVSRRNLETSLAWIFLVGSSSSTATTLCFLYIIGRFPIFLRSVKAEGADPGVISRLTTFYHLNLVRVLFRFIYTVPLLILALDALQGRHNVVRSPFLTDFFIMLASIGCVVSSAITLLIFFPRSADASNEPEHPPKEKPAEFAPEATRRRRRRHASNTPKFRTNGRPSSSGSEQSIRFPFQRTSGDFSAEMTQEHENDPPQVQPPTEEDIIPPVLPYPEEAHTLHRREKTLVAQSKHPTEGGEGSGSQTPINLHPYVVNFTSPIDLHDGSDISHEPRQSV